MANYITTLEDKDGNGLLPNTALKAIVDENGDYLDNQLAASDVSILKGGKIAEIDSILTPLTYYKLGTYVDISAYTDSTYYIAPSDGYIVAATGTNLYDRVSVMIEGITVHVARCFASGYTDKRTLFVRKGTKVSHNSTDSNVEFFRFYPLVEDSN